VTLPGIDISDYQATTPPLAGLAFCIAKASEGMGAARTYGMHVANTRKAGIVTGAYHFGRDDSVGTPAQQAAFFLRTAGDVDLYALDVEGAHALPLAQSQQFIAAMHAAGKRIGMYGSLSGFQHAGQDWVLQPDPAADQLRHLAVRPPPHRGGIGRRRHVQRRRCGAREARRGNDRRPQSTRRRDGFRNGSSAEDHRRTRRASPIRARR